MAKSKKRKKPAWRWRRAADLDPGLRAAVKAVGSMTELAELIDIAPQAISQWDVIPIQRVLEIERLTGVDRERLRPDMFRRRKQRAA
jgi:DNA-binding transcriptional regulator YdaS (Cro superfamily)